MAQVADAVFPMRHGVNYAGPFVRSDAVPPNSNAQVSKYWTLKKFPGWYTSEDVRQAGYDFVRIPIDPAVLLENPSPIRSLLLDEIEASIRSFLSARIRVIFDLHFWKPPNRTWTEQTITEATNTTAFAAYVAIVSDVSLRLSKYPPGDVALELMNEPSRKDCMTGWIPAQRALLQAVRKVSSRLPVVVTGCGGQLDALIALDKSQINMEDNYLIYTFHFYEPFLFTHQGYPYYRHIGGVPYPSTAGTLSKSLETAYEVIDKSGYSPSDTAAKKANAKQEITRYFIQAPNQAFVDQRIGKVVAWADKNGIPTSRLLLGEYAAINWGTSDTAEYLEQRRTWYEDVRASAVKYGIAEAYWTLPNSKGPIVR